MFSVELFTKIYQIFRNLRFDDAAQRRRQRLSDEITPMREVFEGCADTLQMCYNIGKNITLD